MHDKSDEMRRREPVVNPVLLAIAIAWGVGNVIMKWLMGTFRPGAMAALYMGTVAALTLGLWLWRRRRIRLTDAVRLMALGGALFAGHMICAAWAFRLTTASEGSLLVSTAPVWTALLVAVLGLERLSTANWAGAVIALGGVAVVVFGGEGSPTAEAPNRLLGDAVMLAAAWGYAGFMTASKAWMARWGTLSTTCFSFVGAALLLLVAGIGDLRATPWGSLTAAHWAGFAFQTVLAGFVAMLLWYRAVRLTSPARTIVYQYLVPGVSVIVAVIALGDRLTGAQFAGICITLAGVYLARLPVAAKGELPSRRAL